MKCSTCAMVDKKSRVTVKGSVQTLLHCATFYDEDGLPHTHDSNVTKTSYSCSNGHAWTESTSGECWCGWRGLELELPEPNKKEEEHGRTSGQSPRASESGLPGAEVGATPSKFLNVSDVSEARASGGVKTGGVQFISTVQHGVSSTPMNRSYLLYYVQSEGYRVRTHDGRDYPVKIACLACGGTGWADPVDGAIRPCNACSAPTFSKTERGVK